MRFNWGFFVREALKGLRLNLLMSVTAVTTTAVCILILGAGLLVSAHVQGIIRQVGEGVEITAFFPKNASPERIDQARRAVEGFPEVEEVAYVSREEALRRLRTNFAEQPEVVEGLGSNFLPASLEIKLKDPSYAQGVAVKLEGAGFREEDLNYPQQTINELNRITGYIVWALRAATALFLVASVLLISNAIRLSIFARRKEIEVMKLVGASDGFVRWPFVIEGLVQGLIGATLAALVVLWVNALFVEWAQNAVPLLGVSSAAVSTLSVFLILVVVGVAIGVFGSFMSVRRFLKV